MSIVIAGIDGNLFGYRDIDASPNNFIETAHRLVLSGSYVAGGDTLDWTNGNGANGQNIVSLIPSAAAPGAGAFQGPIMAFPETNPTNAAAQSIAGGYYAITVGTGPSNWKLKIFNAGGAEASAGAYSAAILADIIYVVALWRKLL